MKSQIVLYIDAQLKLELVERYPRGVSQKFEAIMRELLNIDDGNEIEDIEKLNAQALILQEKIKTIKMGRIAQDNEQHKNMLSQEKRNYQVIENNFITETRNWDEDKVHRFNREWRTYLEENGYLINDCNRIQYWFRSYLYKKKEFD